MDNRNKNVRSHSDAEAFQYGFSKDVTRNKAKTNRKTKKLNHMKIRVVGGVIATDDLIVHSMHAVLQL